ncbi:uncharacterized protein SPAPADRAFT_47821 [Spathaspora passalidarum NRRL Y-27907]|uniref:Uncharacterized protein n=1 Tax=Spathaspora passalidarum (strain NRRL Y-27907 / 11-Y1) TaxID=619300 RepID=G3AEH5_SPAPN|nr:uncharacterized protein SPAPADRAFT_47821 [Spathaspora passalidarum NRRL Y-27907]EGW34737.1 hypothetical protein SPAPADRAFT_47821 [Spathaspora passalidarum NRRL Y-27907]
MSSEFDPDKYVPTIDAILGVSDMEVITVKRIRNALQELFGVDLQPHKKDINDLITNRYFLLLDKKEEEEKTVKKEREEMERQDAPLAAKLSQTEYYSVGRRLRAVTDHKNGKRKSQKKSKSSSSTDKPKRTAAVGFNKEMVLSNELANLIGQSRASRPQVVKQLWVYIKDNDLQNPEDKRQILCDERLERLFKKKMVTSFEMNKLLTSHIFKPEDISDGLANQSSNGNGNSKVEEIFSHDNDESSEEE